ncbi:MAG: hypothetical protein ACREQV_26010, partial [Candidatus Binatia bacterium]
RPDSFDQTRFQIRHALVRAGANELLTYNFLSSNTLKKTGETPENAYRLVNSLSPELEYYRSSLLPSLLAKVHSNHKLGYDAFALFELNKTHSKKEMDDDKLPRERNELALVWSAADKFTKQYPGAAFYQAKRYLGYLGNNLQLNFRYQLLADAALPEWLQLRSGCFEPKHSAVIMVTDQPIGVIGEINVNVAKNLKLPRLVAGFEADTELLHQARSAASSYRPLSKYPGTGKDMTLRVTSDMQYEEIVSAIDEVLKHESLETGIKPIDIYQSDDDTEHKNITLRLTLTDHQKTITTERANAIVAKAAAAIPGAKQV